MGRPQQNRQVRAFEGQVAASLRRLGAWNRPVLVAVSGGADSLALLEAIAAAGSPRAEVAIVDHGLREVGAEVRLVGARAKAHGLPFHVLTLGLAAGSGVEARARAGRYAALQRLRGERRLELLVTGHTASDQAETLLHRLMRGTSLAGASGVRAVREDGVVRPLLFATRAQTRAYVTALGLVPAEDPMNDDPAFQRVRLRTELIPLMEAIVGAGAQPALARFAALAAEDEALLGAAAQRALGRAEATDGSLDRVAVLSLARPLQRRVLALFLAREGVEVDFGAIEDGLTAISEARRGTLPGDRVLTCRDGQVRVRPAPARTLHGSSSSATGA